MKSCRLSAVLVGVTILVYCCIAVQGSSIKLAAFNIQIFGVSKFRETDVVDILSRIVRRYDITFIQEIRDSSQTVVYKFLHKVNSDAAKEGGGVYDVIVSERLGRSKSKEQYAYLYRKDRVKLSLPCLYEDSHDAFEREPYSILVNSLDKGLPPFFLLGLHADPDEVVTEMNRMDEAFAKSAQFYGMRSGIILGDLNAGCKYLSRTRFKKLDLMKQGDEFIWLIDDHVDTTTRKSTDCAYDRFIVSGEIGNFIKPGSARAFRFDMEYGLNEEQALRVSDHYPIECIIQGASKMDTTFLDLLFNYIQ